jgi:cobalamin biosynthesis Mg chelatase CobN
MSQIACPAFAVIALLIPASASAAPVNCQAPAGTSGIDQYCEVLPGAGGSGSNHHKTKKHVSSQVQQKLQSQGSDGAAILQLTQSSGAADAQTTQTTVVVKKKTTHHKKKSSTAPSNSTPSTPVPAPKTTPQAQSEGPSPGNDPFSAVGNSFSSSTGISGGFAWVLVGILLVFVAMAWISYRGRGREPEAS